MQPAGTDDSPLTDGVVILRAWEVADAQWYSVTAAGDELIQRFTAEAPSVTAQQVQEAIVELNSGKQGAAGFVICDAVTGQRQGNIALDYEDGIGHVSYWLAADARGRGVATRALSLLCHWAFQSLRLDELRLWAHVENVASLKVAERAGFERDAARDEHKTIKESIWPTAAYRLPARSPR